MLIRYIIGYVLEAFSPVRSETPEIQISISETGQHFVLDPTPGLDNMVVDILDTYFDTMTNLETLYEEGVLTAGEAASTLSDKLTISREYVGVKFSAV